MLKKTIEFEDLDGNKLKEDHYFHMSKAELTILANSETGGLDKRIEDILRARDSKALMDMYEKLILDSYGVQSADRKRFIKSKELSEEFKQTDAYSVLFMELLTDDNAGLAFIQGICPKDIQSEITEDKMKEVAARVNM